MEAPNKIYLSPKSFEIGEKFNGILTTKVDGDIEYIRTDAFIEKACEWLDGAIYDYVDTGSIGDFETLRGVKNEQFLEDFRSYMKGE
jgi:hypothetical protein